MISDDAQVSALKLQLREAHIAMAAVLLSIGKPVLVGDEDYIRAFDFSVTWTTRPDVRCTVFEVTHNIKPRGAP